MLKTEITFERILGTFAPGALFMFGGWYLHRPFFLKYFPNLVGGLVEKVTEQGAQVEQIGDVSLGAKLVLFVLISFCVGIVLNQLADIAIAFLFLNEPKNNTAIEKLKRFIKNAARILTLTYYFEDPRVKAIADFAKSARKPDFYKLLRKWTKSNKILLEKFEKNTKFWSAATKNEAVLLHQHIITRLELMSGVSRTVFEEEYFSLNFIASLMMTFIFLLPVSLFSFITSSWTEDSFRVHHAQAIFLMALGTYLGVLSCGMLLKRQFKKLSLHLLNISFHQFLIDSEAIETQKSAGERDKIILDAENEAGQIILK